MRFRAVLWVLGIVVLFALAMHEMRQSNAVYRNTWMNNVQIATQPGSDEASVKRLLGEPSRVETPKDIYATRSFGPAAVRVPGADRVLVYICRYGQPFTAAYIFLDRSGKVLRVRYWASS